jgi:hypothetical protein
VKILTNKLKESLKEKHIDQLKVLIGYYIVGLLGLGKGKTNHVTENDI